MALLGRLARPGAAAPEERCTASGPLDWYEPRGRRRQVAVLLHGLTLAGRRDHRLQGLARALARSGTACAVPELPGLAAARFDPGDVEAAGLAIAAAATECGGPVAVAGFSYGGSLALRAAAAPAWSGSVATLLAFGACHDLSRALARLAELPEPARPEDRDDLLYAHLAAAHRSGEELGLESGLRREAGELLRRHCLTGFGEEKRRFWDERLRPLDLGRRAPLPSPGALAALSPAGALAGLRCPVALLHDPDDLLVPADQAEALAAELRAAGREVELLVTPLLRHVRPAAALRPAEALRLADLVSRLLA